MKDAGIVTICKLTNTSESGMMPREVLSPLMHDDEVLTWRFEDRYIGYSRQYEAKGVGERIDKLIRIWNAPQARIGYYAVLTDYEGQENENGDQYRIDNVQPSVDENGLKVTDLTLYRLDDLYDFPTDET